MVHGLRIEGGRSHGILARLRRVTVVGVAALTALSAASFAVYRFGGLSLVSAATSAAGYSVERDLAYGLLPRQKLDLYRPERPLPGAPAMVFFHGGSWQSGDRGDYRFAAAAFAGAGLTVAIPDYRLYPEAVFPAFMEDGAEAVAMVARRLGSGGRPARIVLAGHSAGAQIAALLVTDERYLADTGLPRWAVAGFVGLSGPYDFLPLQAAIYKAIFPEEIRDASQPISFVDGNEPPMLLLTGDRDRTVDPGNSTRLAARVRSRGGRAEVRSYSGAGHLGTLLALAAVLPFGKPPVLEDVMAFVRGLGEGAATGRAPVALGERG